MTDAEAAAGSREVLADVGHGEGTGVITLLRELRAGRGLQPELVHPSRDAGMAVACGSGVRARSSSSVCLGPSSSRETRACVSREIMLVARVESLPMSWRPRA